MNTQTTTDQIGQTAMAEPSLSRSLSFTNLVVYGMTFMIPIAPMGIYGYVVSEAQGMASLAYLIGMIAMVFTALSYSRMSAAFPVAGSVYSYAGGALSRPIGFLTGWVILLDYLLIPSLCYVVAANVLAGITGIPVMAWLAAFILFNTVINIIGIDATAKTNNLFVICQLGILLWFVVLGLMLVFGHQLGEVSAKPFYNPATFQPSLVMTAVSLAALSFLGFDAISTLSEETRGGRETVGRATLAVLFIMGGLFVLQTWVAGMVWPDFAALAADKDNAFFAIAAAVGGKSLQTACAVATAVSWGFSAALVAQTATARILFSMARDKALPSVLARLHPRFRTPYISTLLVAALSLVLCFIFMERVDELTSLVNFGALSAFFVLNLCALNYFLIRQKSGRWLRDGLVPLCGLVVVGYVWISLSRHALIAGAIWIVIGMIYLFFNRHKQQPLTLEE